MNHHTLTGSCRCGKITLEVNLSAKPDTYNPRACDCDFCCEHAAAYIMDPKGSVVIRATDMSRLISIQQGDKLAEFLCCMDCDQLLGVRWLQYGTVNAQVIADNLAFGETLPASPKHLSAEQKVSLWKRLWFPEFMINTADS